MTLDDVWATLSTSPYLRSLGCRVLSDQTARAIELNHIPGVPDGMVLTASRDTFERGLPEVSGLRFASYGEPAFDAILALTAVAALPLGIRRVSVPIPGADGAEIVGYVVMRRNEDGAAAPHVVRDMADLDDLAIDAETPVPPSAIESLRAHLAACAKDEFRVLLRRGESRKSTRVRAALNYA